MPAIPSTSNNDVDEDIVVESDIDYNDDENQSDEETVTKPKKILGDPDECPIFADIVESEVADQSEKEAESRGLAILPCMGVVKVAPSNPPKINRTQPTENLELDFVHGYRCHDSRNNLVYNTKGLLVYPAASLIITMDSKTRKQKYYKGHNNDVLCMAQNPVNKDIVASGQIATVIDGKSKKPHICIHNTVTDEDWILNEAGDRAISAVAFSHDGEYLISSACDDKYSVSIWDWKNGVRLASSETDSKSQIISLAFNPANNNEFVSVGNNHVVYWTYNPNGGKKKLTKTMLNDKIPKQLYISVCFNLSGKQMLLGAKDGGIYVFNNNSASKVFRVHENKINSISLQGKHFISGGDDKRVCILNNKLEPVIQYEFQYQIRSVYSDEYGNLLIGTRGSEIFEIPYSVQKDHYGYCITYKQINEPVISGHFDGEVWSVTPHPTKPLYISTGEDNQIIIYDVESKKVSKIAPISLERGEENNGKGASTTSTHPVNQTSRAIDISPDGKYIALGTNEGAISIHDGATLKVIKFIDNSKFGSKKSHKQQNWIEAIRFSPTGNILAVGVRNTGVVLLSVKDNFSVKSKLTEHTSAVLAIDFSADGNFIRSVSQSYELLYHSIDENNLSNSKLEGSATKMRDVIWATVSVKFDWSTMGIWRKLDGTKLVEYFKINSVDANPKRNLLAVGTDFGVLNLFRFPCAVDDPTKPSENNFKSYTGHSSHIPRVRFDYSGQYLFSTGGNDKCLFQWKVKK